MKDDLVSGPGTMINNLEIFTPKIKILKKNIRKLYFSNLEKT